MDPLRLLKHLCTPDWIAHRPFPAGVLEKIEQAVKASERKHDGELRFVAEAGLPLSHLFPEKAVRQRAEQLFAQLGVWDTERNSGVLIYVQLVDRRIEIVADRGISSKVAQSEWAAICRSMEKSFKEGKFADGALQAIERSSALLAKHFPPLDGNPNELPDKPVLL
jgi:TPM domain